MRSYVIFKDNKMFNSSKVWDLQDVLDKFNRSGFDFINMGGVDVKTDRDKVLQKGVIISAKDELDAVEKLKRIENIING